MPKTCTSCGNTYPDTMVFCPTDGSSLRLDDAQGDLIGTVIADRYLVSQLLGEGGMGKVYLASHVRLPQKAAIKVLHHDMVQDTGAVARFNREAANAARIEHDRVARVFDFGETSDGLVYIAMEFVPGKTLRDLLEDSPRLPPVRAANIVYQVAEGLDAAHRLTIVHRDLKPDNVLVMTDEAGVDRCKVVDFGIAKATNSTETQLTQAGMLVGTPEFMSPEQVLGEQLDGRSDVYALALVAYEMFTGALPFEGNTPERKLTARLIQDPKPLSEVAPDVDWPASLQQAFNHALEREPDARTASALDFADAVVNAVEEWAGVPVLRARTPMSTTAITAAANLSTGAMNRPGAESESRPASTVAKTFTPGAGTSASKMAIPEPAAKKTPWAAIAAAVVVIGAVGGYFALQGGGEGASSITPPASTPVVDPKRPVTYLADGSVDSSGAGGAASRPAPAASVPMATTPPASTSDAPPARVVATTPPPAAAAPPRSDTSAASASAAVAAEARRSLDAIRTTLSNTPDGDELAVATRAFPQITQLLPRLGSATDSTYAYLALTSVHGMMGRADRACEPYRMAKRLAATRDQRETIDLFAQALTCAL